MKNETKKLKTRIKFCLILCAMVFLYPENTLHATNEVATIKDVDQSSVTITGFVHDANNEPLIGVTVSVKGTNKATMTDIDGKFTISVPNGNAILEFTYVGYTKQAVAVDGKTNINVELKEDTKLLDEVVVVGYGSMKKSDVATAITTVKPENFNRGGGRDVKSLLEGRVAGLTVTRNEGSDPTSGVAVQMRGVVSISGSVGPLIVIDGIPGGNVDLLRDDDIESIEVLKDGSAAAIYGSRANGGVIIITTKKGQAGVTNVEYSTYFLRYSKAKDPGFLNASQYRALRSELNDPSYMADYGGDTDWYDEIMDKNNLSQSHNLSVSGGTNSGTFYRASLYYSDLNGIAKANQRQQYGGRISLTTKAYDNMLTIQANLSTNFSYMDKLGNEGWESALKFNPTAPIHNSDGTYFEIDSKDENKVARLEQQKKKRTQQTTSLDTKFTLEPIKNLQIAISGGVTRDNYNNNEYFDKDSRTSIKSYQGGGYAYKSSYLETNGFAEPTVNYEFILKDEHKINALAGYSYQYKVYEKFDANNKGFLNDAFQENNLGAGSWLSGANGNKAGMTSEKKDETLIAFFGRVNYVYQTKYVAQFSIRREGSSKFGANNKWGSFPSASLAWNVSNEDFMKNIPVLSNLKMRLGYGETGNSTMDPYQSISTIGTGGNYLSPDGTWNQTYGPNKNPNPNLKWETKKEWNFGLDFGVINNRITGAVDYYIRNAEDLLVSGVTVPVPSNIHSTSTVNLGDIKSKGLEITINAIPISKKDFTWTTDFIFSHIISNTIGKFSYMEGSPYFTKGEIGGSGALGDAFRYYEGSDVGNYFGKRFAGFDENGEWLFYNKNGEAVSADKISDSDKTTIGNAVPKYYLSLFNNFTYKNFDMSIGFRSRLKFDVLNRLKMTYGNKRTLRSGDNVLSNIQTDGVDATYQYSDYYLEKGDFLKLDNITIGYTFQKNNPKIPTFRVYATARDLFTITGYDGIDPELDDTGLEPSLEGRSRSPLTRSFMVGMNIKF